MGDLDGLSTSDTFELPAVVRLGCFVGWMWAWLTLFPVSVAVPTWCLARISVTSLKDALFISTWIDPLSTLLVVSIVAELCFVRRRVDTGAERELVCSHEPVQIRGSFWCQQMHVETHAAIDYSHVPFLNLLEVI